MHPLPRVNEISAQSGRRSRAPVTSSRSQNGKFIREALIMFLLGLM